MKLLRSLSIILLIICMLVSCDFLPSKDYTTVTSITTQSTIASTTNSISTTTKPSSTTSGTISSSTTNITTTTPPVEDNFFDPDQDVLAQPEDPYVNVDKAEFYSNYTPAQSYWDSYYRSKHYLMSGSIEDQDQEPTISDYQPKEDGLFVRNTSALYSSDGNIYYVIDANGNIVNKIYKGGAYVTLEEVAAYVFAFGDVPANYVASKSTKPYNSNWGEYLRLNHSYFSGNTSRYPYEPELPRISGEGGDLDYYEIDIGTTGTDCDPSYTAAIYNNGSKITRGAARIVYTRYDKNGDEIIDLDEKYLFYTYNHYNDFQEYLNYEGGWGEMFGNITGGGTISSKYDYNPTPYVAVVRRNLYNGTIQSASEVQIIEYAFIYFDRKYYYANAFCG